MGDDLAVGRSLLIAAAVAVGLALLGAGTAAASPGPALVTPRNGEASFGEVVAQAPPLARDAVLLVGGRWAARVRVEDGEARFRLRGRVGPQRVTVRFVGAGAGRLGEVSAARVWLLPASGAVARRAGARDAALSARLRALGEAYPGWAGLYVQDLATGRTASWNADASFLAASTVKLGVMIEALRRNGPNPELSAAWRDIAAMVSLSANDSANRLFLALGTGSEESAGAVLAARFKQLGARDTTFPSLYRVGQARGATARAAGAALDIPKPTPFLPWRRTSARDLGIVVRAIHAAALGDRDALRRTGLTVHEARLGLALMLDARPEGGPLLGAVRAGLPVAQKTGWTEKARHAAAIVYAPGGPRIVVVLTYRPGLDAAASGRLAREVMAVVRVGAAG